MPGWLTNGLPTIGAVTQNGAAQTAPNGVYTNVGAAALLPLDTETAAGPSPQSVAATAFQVAALAAGLIQNSATSTASAATLSVNSGRIYTEALTTAIGSNYTMTVTNTLVATTSAIPQVQIHKGTASAGQLDVTSITNASGSFVAVFTNNGSAAVNGTELILFHL